jgi:hypothetical protein
MSDKTFRGPGDPSNLFPGGEGLPTEGPGLGSPSTTAMHAARLSPSGQAAPVAQPVSPSPAIPGYQTTIAHPGERKGVMNVPTADGALRIVPREPWESDPKSPALVMATSVENRLKKSHPREEACGPPFAIGYFLCDGRHPSLLGYLATNRFVLGRPTGQAIFLLGIGDLRHHDQVCEQLAGDSFREWTPHFARERRQTAQLHGGEDQATIAELDSLVRRLEARANDLPCIVFLTCPRFERDVVLRIPPELLDLPGGLRKLTDVLRTRLSANAVHPWAASGKSIEEVTRGCESQCRAIELELRQLAGESGELRTRSQEWESYPALGNVQFSRRARTLRVNDDDYQLTVDQEKVIRVMLLRSRNGARPLRHADILEQAGLASDRRLRDIFKRSDLWKLGWIAEVPEKRTYYWLHFDGQVAGQ